jgi:hypothetical protein
MGKYSAAELHSKALRDGARLGREIFGLSMEVIVEQESPWPAVAMYDRWADRVKIFANRVAQEAAAGADSERLVTQAVAHEFGHGREARLFAESGVCPWYLCVDANCKLETEQGFYLGKDFHREFAQLTSRIQDFPIDRKLSEYGVRDQTAKARITRIEQLLQREPSDPVGRMQLRLQTLFYLPSDLRHHAFGDISDEDKIRIRQFTTSVLGERTWEQAARLISSREFGDIVTYERITTAYFRDFLNIEAKFESVARERLGELPVFWTSPTYRALHIY